MAKSISPEVPTGDVDVDCARAVLFAQIGRGKEAVALFRAVLAARPGDTKAINGLATCHRATSEDNDLARIEAALASKGLTRSHGQY